MEICDTLQKGGWGYREAAQHLTVDEALAKLRTARHDDANLLLNTGPLPDGSIHPADVAVMRAMR